MSKRSITIQIDEKPPSINTFYAHTGKRRFITKKGREFKEYVEWQLKSLRIPPFGSARLKMTYEFNFKGKRKRDTSNYIKVMEDCLSGILFDDDEQVDEVIARRHYDKDDFVIITIEEAY